jgi:hypothetical protein
MNAKLEAAGFATPKMPAAEDSLDITAIDAKLKAVGLDTAPAAAISGHGLGGGIKSPSPRVQGASIG